MYIQLDFNVNFSIWGVLCAHAGGHHNDTVDQNGAAATRNAGSRAKNNLKGAENARKHAQAAAAAAQATT